MGDDHAHCWHYVQGYTDGLGSSGSEQHVCCHCGDRRTRNWHSSPDPAHGRYAPGCTPRIRQYEEAEHE